MKAYRSYSAVENMVDEDDKPKVLLKVFQAMMERLEGAKQAITNKDYQKKFAELTKVTTTLDVLSSCLDMSQGDIPKNLAALYDYCARRLRGVHRSCDTAVIDECRMLIGSIFEGFAKAYEAETKGQRLTPATAEKERALGSLLV